MTDEEIRALCLQAALRSIPGHSAGAGGGDILREADRIFAWVKRGDITFTVTVGAGGGGTKK